MNLAPPLPSLSLFPSLSHLEDDVFEEGVLDTPDHVLCLALRQLHRLAGGLEQRPQLGELRYGRQLFCRGKTKQ